MEKVLSINSTFLAFGTCALAFVIDQVPSLYFLWPIIFVGASFSIFQLIDFVGCGCGGSCGMSSPLPLNFGQKIIRGIVGSLFLVLSYYFFLSPSIILKMLSSISLWFGMSFVVAMFTGYK